jgi:hypothetical protein
LDLADITPAFCLEDIKKNANPLYWIVVGLKELCWKTYSIGFAADFAYNGFHGSQGTRSSKSL